MAHCIQAFVTTPAAARSIAARHAEAVVLELTPTINLVPLTDALIAAICPKGVASLPVPPFATLNQRVLGYMQGLAGEDALGYLETEYFGGVGVQAAALWIGRRAVLQPSEHAAVRDVPTPPSADWPINRMLAALGVARIAPQDEFDTVGLGHVHHMREFRG